MFYVTCISRTALCVYIMILSLGHKVTRGGSASVGRAPESKARRNADAGSKPRHEIFLPESPFSADSLTVSAQLPRAVACINICIQLKNPNTGSHTIVRTDENTTHTLTGMGSAALAAAMLCAAKTTRSIRKDSNNEVLK